MKNKCRAYALTEMIIIIVVLVVVISLLVKPIRTLTSEIPRSARVCRALNTTQQALAQLKNDIEACSRIVSYHENILTLENDNNQITYLLTEGKIIRRPGLNPMDAEYTWLLPNVKMIANTWEQNNTPYALELTTWNELSPLGKKQKQFTQSVVFFQKDKKR